MFYVGEEIVLRKYDVLFTSTYKRALGKDASIVCAEEGTFDRSEWDVRLGSDVYVGFTEYPKEYSTFGPPFKSMTFPFEVVSTESGRCVEVRLTGIPTRGIEFIVYTTNDTYLEILEDLLVTLTSSDHDAFSKLSDKGSMNYIVLVLDDLPAGSTINLMCIPKRANVFLLGFKAASLDMLYDCLDFYEKLDRREDGHTVEWARFLAKYLVKSVTYDTVNTLFLAMINYQGTRVKCTMFYALLCLFANPKDMSKFSAQLAQTDTLTYQAMLALTFRELLVLPVSADPPNILVVTQIDFDRKKLQAAYQQTPRRRKGLLRGGGLEAADRPGQDQELPDSLFCSGQLRDESDRRGGRQNRQGHELRVHRRR